MKLVVEGGLYDLLYAACTYASEYSPAERINEYIVANGVLPPNIRADNQQPNVWRDYQQFLSELGFMYSTQLTQIIIPTPTGLSLLDNKNRVKEIVTQQTLLYQYLNGGKREYADEQINNGVLLRPAVLIWRVLSLLLKKGEISLISSSEIRNYLMRCCTHSDSLMCVEAIVKSRKNIDSLQENKLQNAGRNAADWIALLSTTLLFETVKVKTQSAIKLSNYSIENLEEIDDILENLEDEKTFWRPTYMDDNVRKEWYAFYGALRFDYSLPTNNHDYDEVDVETNGDNQEINFGFEGDVHLNIFNPLRLNYNITQQENRNGSIESSYDAAMVGNKHRLHDSMVVYIANVCKLKGAEIFEDPSSIDLLITYEQTEYLVEVKSISSKNYIKRLRYAIGQLFHYDFMLSPLKNERRKVLALPNVLPASRSIVPFFNNHLDIDLLSLKPTSDGQILHCNSNYMQTKNLFCN